MDFFDLVSNLPLNSLLTAYQPLFSETLRTADRCTVQPAQAALLPLTGEISRGSLPCWWWVKPLWLWGGGDSKSAISVWEEFGAGLLGLQRVGYEHKIYLKNIIWFINGVATGVARLYPRGGSCHPLPPRRSASAKESPLKISSEYLSHYCLVCKPRQVYPK